MQGKLALAAGFAAGYVLGSKAGRQRYEEIVAQARRVAGNQTVQSTAGVLQAQASDLVNKAKQSELVNKAKQSDLVNKAKQTVGRGAKGDDTPSTTTTYSTPSSSAYTAESEALSTPSTTGSSDLFEPSPTSSTTDPLSPRNPTSGNGSNL